MTGRRGGSFVGSTIPAAIHGTIIGDSWIDTTESPPREKVCTSLDPYTFTVLSQAYSLPESVLKSEPPSGYCKVIGIYVNPTTGKTVVKYDDTPI